MRPAIELGGGGGLRVRLLPDRALDCGAAWFAGVPIAWLSGIGAGASRETDLHVNVKFGATI